MEKPARKLTQPRRKSDRAVHRLYAQLAKLRDEDEAEEDREYEALLRKRKAGKG